MAASAPPTDRSPELDPSAAPPARPPLRVRTVVAVAWGGTLALVALALAAAQVFDRPFSDLTRDPIAVVGGAPIYVGFLSNVAVLLWAGAAAACIVAGLALRRLGDARGRLLLEAGALSTVLAVDDLFRVHETLNERLGVPQPLLPAVYAAAIVALGARHRELLRRTEWRLLAVALALFALSAALDAVLDPTPTGTVEALEDVLKVIGVATWAAYFVLLAVHALVHPGAPRAAVPTAAGTREYPRSP